MIVSNLKAKLDSENFRYVIEPLPTDENALILSTLRSIMKCTNTTWRELADFLGLKSTNEAFCATYGSSVHYRNIQLRNKIRLLYVADKGGNKAYLYHKDHAPEVILPTPYIPALYSTDDAVQTVVDRIPTRVTSRTEISYVYYDKYRPVTLTATPVGGYVYVPGSLPADTDTPVTWTNMATKTLNNILKELYFVGDGVNENGKLTITLTDPVSKKSSEKVITIKIVENKEIPAPKISLPQGFKLNLDKFTPVTGISVSEKNNRMVRVIVTPFNARMSVSNLINPVPPRGIYDITGTPDKVNAYLATIAIHAQDKTAQLGVKVRCGNIEKLEYLKFGYNETESPDTEQSESSSTEAKAATTLASQSAVPTLIADEHTGARGAQIALHASLSTEGVTEEQTLEITPTNCSIAGLAKAPVTSGKTVTLTNTVDKINDMLASSKVVIGQGTGNIKFKWNNGKATKTVTVSITS